MDPYGTPDFLSMYAARLPELSAYEQAISSYGPKLTDLQKQYESELELANRPSSVTSSDALLSGINMMLPALIGAVFAKKGKKGFATGLGAGVVGAQSFLKDKREEGKKETDLAKEKAKLTKEQMKEILDMKGQLEKDALGQLSIGNRDLRNEAGRNSRSNKLLKNLNPLFGGGEEGPAVQGGAAAAPVSALLDTDTGDVVDASDEDAMANILQGMVAQNGGDGGGAPAAITAKPNMPVETTAPASDKEKLIRQILADSGVPADLIKQYPQLVEKMAELAIKTSGAVKAPIEVDKAEAELAELQRKGEAATGTEIIDGIPFDFTKTDATQGPKTRELASLYKDLFKQINTLEAIAGQTALSRFSATTSEQAELARNMAATTLAGILSFGEGIEGGKSKKQSEDVLQMLPDVSGGVGDLLKGIFTVATGGIGAAAKDDSVKNLRAVLRNQMIDRLGGRGATARIDNGPLDYESMSDEELIERHKLMSELVKRKGK